MSADKHPAEVLADKISPAGTHSLAWCKDAASRSAADRCPV
jgi:hypothetical protein